MSRVGRRVAGVVIAVVVNLLGAPAFAQTPIAPPGAPQTGVAFPGAAAAPGPVYLAPGVKPDLAFGAFQRGLFVTAFREAMKRIEADGNDAPAMTIIGELYRDGLGVRTDPAEAARWYKLAADRGDPQGAYAFALACLQARGVKEDRALGKKYLEQAAARDHVGAQYNLGLMATEERPPDYAAAARHFQHAADRGSIDGAYALALMYKEGTGVEKDARKSIGLLRRAAAEHMIAAELELGVAYFNGEGVEADEALAASYFRRAAVRNNPVAGNRLARILAAGRGVQQDLVEAMKWHILARAAGIDDEWLDGHLLKLTPQQRLAVDEAVKKHIGQ
jgi:TPR repeat protein